MRATNQGTGYWVRVQGAGSYAILALVPTLLCAQAKPQKPALDRTVQPAVAKPADMKVPAWTKTKLANGADFIVSVKHGLPLVSVSVDFIGGTAQFEDPAKLGTATLTAQMM